MPLPLARSWTAVALSRLTILISTLLPTGPSLAQDSALRPGEAFVTRFSGAVAGPGGPVINPAGTVGSIIDMRAPGQPPLGQHWIDEPQRKPVTAAQVGQVFGVTFDDASPPNIYLSATPAFGLHRTPDNAQWMAGMWGPGGGPGTIYRLDAASGYTPRVFSQIALNGRPNSGPALGNLTFDRFNKQLFVSDLETGMIQRVRAADGGNIGVYDHGAQGRTNFVDVETGERGNLPPIAFDPSSRPHLRLSKPVRCHSGLLEHRGDWPAGLGPRRAP